MDLLKHNDRDDSYGVNTTILADEFDRRVRSNENAAEVLVEGAKAFVKANALNGKTVTLQEGFNMTVGWLGYHDATSRHTPEGQQAISTAEAQVASP